MSKFIIRADRTEGYETAREYCQAARAYHHLPLEHGRTYESMAEVDARLAELGAKREMQSAFGTDRDSAHARDHGQVRVGMVCFVLATNNMRMGNGYKVLTVR